MKKNLIVLMIGILFSCKTHSNITHGATLTIERNTQIADNSVNVKGNIFDLYDKFGLEHAVIELSNNENTYKESCIENGDFKFKSIPPGKYRLSAGFIGYKTLIDSLEVIPQELIILRIGLGYDE